MSAKKLTSLLSVCHDRWKEDTVRNLSQTVIYSHKCVSRHTVTMGTSAFVTFILIPQCTSPLSKTVLNPSGELFTKFKRTRLCLVCCFKFHGKADLQANTQSNDTRPWMLIPLRWSNRPFAQLLPGLETGIRWRSVSHLHMISVLRRAESCFSCLRFGLFWVRFICRWLTDRHRMPRL